MKNRIDCWALSTVGALTVVALALLGPATCAQSLQGASRLSPVHLDTTVTHPEALTASASPTVRKRSSSAPRPKAKAQRTPPAAAVLRIEAKEAARQAVRNEQAAREQLAGLDASRRIAPNVMTNLREPVTPPRIEMGDRPARSLSLCGDGKTRRFAELDSKTVAALLPEFNALRPRTVCARRGVLIADYAFK